MAKHSSSRRKYKLFFLSNKYIKKINTAKKLYESINKELEQSKISNHNKYDIWTEILKKNIISRCIKNLSKKEKIKYDSHYHSKLRNNSRFTYPETILAREKLIKKKYLISKKEIVNKVDFIKNKLIPKRVLGFTSSALITLNKMFNSKSKLIEVVSFKIKFDGKRFTDNLISKYYEKLTKSGVYIQKI